MRRIEVRRVVGWIAVAAMGAVAGPLGGVARAGEDLIVFEERCDASAAVFALGGALLVADDRTDELATYRPGGGEPIAITDLYPLTGTPRHARRNFSAFEGVARQGRYIYFVTSHGRERQGKNRPNRRRLLALESTVVGFSEKIEPVGVAYTELNKRLAETPELRGLGLAGAIMELHRQLPHLAPSKRGINIEGLAAGSDGSLLVALRNPRSGGRAILIPILNPDRVILGLADPDFGPPIRLDLGGLGIASIARSPVDGVYYIVAARHDFEGESRLFRWLGRADDAPVPVQTIAPADFDAQGLAISRDGKRIMLVSDDGDRPVAVESPEACGRLLDPDGTCPCNMLADDAQKRFRGQWITLSEDSAGEAGQAAADGGSASAKP